MSDESSQKNDALGLFLRAMVDREPGKRKVKPSKAALIDLGELDLGESSDDSDFNVDEEQLNEDDDVSINSDPDAIDDDDDDDESDDEDEEDEEESEDEVEEQNVKSQRSLSIGELLQQAKEKQALNSELGREQPKILVCAVCLGDYSDDTNEIVSCDGCRVSVHEGCYGISDNVSVTSTDSSCPTEPWFCDACKAGVKNPACELCPNLSYTIFKETEMGRWVHLVCALYVPGIAFSEVDRLSFPTLFEMPYSKWGLKVCSLCEDERYSKTGVCIGCDAGMCRAYFHVTCAQREGLLSEVNHGEADQADPYYAHCRLHTDRELIRRRKRNWLALQLHMKQSEEDRNNMDQESQDRLVRKLHKYSDMYKVNKSNRPAPWYPTQKMPRPVSTCASLFRSLLRKTELMGISTETSTQETPTLGDIRKKWHIPPAFNVEFISYYLDRNSRLQSMKHQLNLLLKENNDLVKEEEHLRIKYKEQTEKCKALRADNESLLNESLEMHDLLKVLAGRPLRLPTLLASLQNPAQPVGTTATKGKEKRLITKGAAKMVSDPITVTGGSQGHSSRDQGSTGSSKNMSTSSIESGEAGSKDASDGIKIHSCSVCSESHDQHLLIECDTCSHYYHLACLDPPLTRMPKKTKQMGWQCSDCCKSSDSDKSPEVDMLAPRRLRRLIKEPVKFSPTVSVEQKTVYDRSADVKVTSTVANTTANTSTVSATTPTKGASLLSKRRRSTDSRKSAKKAKKVVTTEAVVPGDIPSEPSVVPEKEEVVANSSNPKEVVTIDAKEITLIDSEGKAIEEIEEAKTLDTSVEEIVQPSGSTSSRLPSSTPEGGSEGFTACSSTPAQSPSDSHQSHHERKHREGGKKKKKDKEKSEGGRKRKKHHRREKHSIGEMASELVTPFRIKIKPLPPRPLKECETIVVECGDPAPPQPTPPPSEGHTTTTTTAPPGYPPLPPGYMLTQPLPVSQVSTVSSAARNEPRVPAVSGAAESVVLPSESSAKSVLGARKKSDSTDQFSKCDVCGEMGGVTNTVSCDECMKAYHFNCLEPPLKKSPKRRGYSWFCEDCDGSLASTPGRGKK